MERQAAIDATTSSIATKTTNTGSLTAIVGGLTANEWLAIAGAVIAVLGFFTNLYFQDRRDRREQREHERRMQLMESELGD